MRKFALAAAILLSAILAGCGGGGGGGGGSGSGPTTSSGSSSGGSAASAITMQAIPGLPAPVPMNGNGQCVSQTDSYGTINCIGSISSLSSKYSALTGSVPISMTFPSQQLTTGTGSCSGGVSLSTGAVSLTSGVGNDSLAFANANVMEFTISPSYLNSLGVGSSITGMSVLIYSDKSNPGHFILVEQVAGSSPMTLVGSFQLTSPVGASVSSLAGKVVMCAATGTSSGGTSGGTGAALSCPSGFGGGTSTGLTFYNPNGYSYQLSTTSALASDLSTFTWGVKYNNISNLATSSYSGSLRAELWAVSSSYSGGTISGYRLGTFTPNFTGSGAYSSSQLYVGGYSTNTIQSSGSVTNPPAGNYCVVGTLEQYNGGYSIVDWIQFSGAATFK